MGIFLNQAFLLEEEKQLLDCPHSREQRVIVSIGFFRKTLYRLNHYLIDRSVRFKSDNGKFFRDFFLRFNKILIIYINNFFKVFLFYTFLFIVE